MMRWLRRGGGARADLVFAGRMPAALSFRLLFLLLVSLGVHAAAFYLFEVAYPESRKELAREAGFLLLRENDPEARAVLARHEERLRVFSGYGRPAPQALPRIGMRLGYENYEPRLLPMILSPPEPEPGVSITRDRPAAPSLDVTAPAAAPAMLMEWMDAAGAGVRERREAEKPGFSPGAGRTVWQAAIDSEGRVRHLVLVDGAAAGVLEPMRRMLLGAEAPPALPRPEPGALAWVRLVVVF